VKCINKNKFTTIKIEVIIFMKELVWEMFRKTGKVEYYMRYKELERQEKEQ
jgi:hypothetical protein